MGYKKYSSDDISQWYSKDSWKSIYPLYDKKSIRVGGSFDTSSLPEEFNHTNHVTIYNNQERYLNIFSSNFSRTSTKNMNKVSGWSDFINGHFPWGSKSIYKKLLK